MRETCKQVVAGNYYFGNSNTNHQNQKSDVRLRFEKELSMLAEEIFDNFVELSGEFIIDLPDDKLLLIEKNYSSQSTIKDDDGNEIVVLNYHRDNEYCYYKIFDSEEECQSFLDEYMEED